MIKKILQDKFKKNFVGKIIRFLSVSSVKNLKNFWKKYCFINTIINTVLTYVKPVQNMLQNMLRNHLCTT